MKTLIAYYLLAISVGLCVFGKLYGFAAFFAAALLIALADEIADAIRVKGEA